MANPNPTPKQQNLIPVTERSEAEAKEIARKGGLAQKGIRKYSQMKCRNCDLPCPLKEQGTTEGWKCKVPDAKRTILEAAASPDMFKNSLFTDAFEIQTMADDFEKKLKVAYFKLNLKKELYPTPQLHGVAGHIDVRISVEDA